MIDKDGGKYSPKTMDLCYSLAARQFTRFIARIYQKHLQVTGISGGDFAILEFLAAGTPLTINQLGEALFMERTSLLRILRPLQESGFVETVRDPQEMRRNSFSLTTIGMEKLLEARPFWEAAQAEVEGAIGQREARRLREGLTKALPMAY
ncbi:MarR family winged helix-turn-helix transcriptional regulator [Rhizobium rhizogenes]|uniref:MarR family winged helix-turn-helix transcriptional regulator n=1 Tax=Rhizobium rhizogenes TaxID=359 RepID=UPI00157466C6|nr:MarR family winged helix-turn-helix transcriptional regulator [Rhizobium rhizogenes]NTF98263.1 winged helix-turn-helix transcriptional regulator [Rhizobium rhizogenes]